MSCEHSEQTIEDALRGVAGVSDTRANREADIATIEGNSDTTNLVQAAEDVGYTAHA